jgi:hypothetical protein
MKYRFRSNNLLQSMNITTQLPEGADEKKDNLFDSQASPHSIDTKATTAGFGKTLRDGATMRDGQALESPRKS